MVELDCIGHYDKSFLYIRHMEILLIQAKTKGSHYAYSFGFIIPFISFSFIADVTRFSTQFMKDVHAID